MGNKGDAEKMKVLITEERYRHEAKFAEPESNPSNHNFAIAVSARRVCVWLCLWLSPILQSTKVLEFLQLLFHLQLFLLLFESFPKQPELRYFGTLSSSIA